MSDLPRSLYAHLWPFPRWYPVLLGAAWGLILRLMFYGEGDERNSAMTVAFIYGAPFAVGAVAVYLAESQWRRGWSYYAWLGSRAAALAVLGSMLILVEGLICAVVIVPLFMLFGGIGGLIMGAICRLTRRPRGTVAGFAAMPLMLALLMPSGAGEPHIGHAMRSVVIAAPPAAVWRELHQTTAIAPHEVNRAWMYRIGVPVPESGVTRQVGQALERDVRMGKSIRFAQVATDWREDSYVKWHYRFSPDSVPYGALDDHVKIGGHYFDVLDTIYTLEPQAGGTRLTISMHYRVSTQFNWYATPVADLLFANFEEVILDFYARRAERAALSSRRFRASSGLPRPAALPPTSAFSPSGACASAPIRCSWQRVPG